MTQPESESQPDPVRSGHSRQSAEPAVRPGPSPGRGVAVAVAIVLGLAAAVLGGLYADAEGARRDGRHRAAQLAARNAEQEAQLAALRDQLDGKQQQLSAEQARYAAVEPCLRQLVSPPVVKPPTKEELRRLAEEALKNLPPPPGSGTRYDALQIGTIGPREMLPACKDVGKQLN